MTLDGLDYIQQNIIKDTYCTEEVEPRKRRFANPEMRIKEEGGLQRLEYINFPNSLHSNSVTFIVQSVVSTFPDLKSRRKGIPVWSQMKEYVIAVSKNKYPSLEKKS